MTGFSRKLKRASFRANAKEWEGTPQLTIFDDEGGYDTLHYTRGWQRVSGARIRARTHMAQRYGFIR